MAPEPQQPPSSGPSSQTQTQTQTSASLPTINFTKIFDPSYSPSPPLHLQPVLSDKMSSSGNTNWDDILKYSSPLGIVKPDIVSTYGPVSNSGGGSSSSSQGSSSSTSYGGSGK